MAESAAVCEVHVGSSLLVVYADVERQSSPTGQSCSSDQVTALAGHGDSPGARPQGLRRCSRRVFAKPVLLADQPQDGHEESVPRSKQDADAESLHDLAAFKVAR